MRSHCDRTAGGQHHQTGREEDEGVVLMEETVYTNPGGQATRHESRSRSGTTQPRSKSVKSSREQPDAYQSKSKRRSRNDTMSSARQNRHTPPQATANPRTEHTSRDETRKLQGDRSSAHHSWHDSRSGPIERLLDDVFSCDTNVQYRSVIGTKQPQRRHRRHHHHGSPGVSQTQDGTKDK